MQALIDETQQEFRDVAQQIARSIGIENPTDTRGADPMSGWPTLTSAGLLELRERTDGAPLASGVEIALLCEALGSALSPAPYLPSAALATDLIARSGDEAGWLSGITAGADTYSLLLCNQLLGLAEATDDTAGILWGGATEAGYALSIRRNADGGATVARRAAAGADVLDAISPTNELRAQTGGTWELGGTVTADDLRRFEALVLTGLAADTVGALRAALNGLVEYSKQRIAYGVPIGSFQAIQHLAATDYVSIEGLAAAVNYASWGIDELGADEALLAARTAKAAASAIALPVSEDIMQMYGGIGQTWDHIAHFYTRRAMFNAAVFGDETHQLAAIADQRLSGA